MAARPEADREQEIREAPEESEAGEGDIGANNSKAESNVMNTFSEGSCTKTYKKKTVTMNQIMR